jgi:hypothetical protein
MNNINKKTANAVRQALGYLQSLDSHIDNWGIIKCPLSYNELGELIDIFNTIAKDKRAFKSRQRFSYTGTKINSDGFRDKIEIQ